MFRYKYSFKYFALFAKAGITNGFALTEKNHVIFHYNSVLYKDDKALDFTRKYEQGYCGALGILYSRFSIEVMLEKSNGMSGYEDLNSAVTRFYYLLSYKF